MTNYLGPAVKFCESMRTEEVRLVNLSEALTGGVSDRTTNTAACDQIFVRSIHHPVAVRLLNDVSLRGGDGDFVHTIVPAALRR